MEFSLNMTIGCTVKNVKYTLHMSLAKLGQDSEFKIIFEQSIYKFKKLKTWNKNLVNLP